MRKFSMVGWFTGFALFLTSSPLLADPKQPTPKSFCDAELAARGVLNTYSAALDRAQAQLGRLGQKAAKPLPPATPDLAPVMIGLTRRKLPVSSNADAGVRLATLIQEFKKGRDEKIREAFTLYDDRDIERYLRNWIEIARSGPQVDPDFYRKPLKFSWGWTKRLGTIGGIVLLGAAGIAGATLPDPALLEIPAQVTDWVPAAGIGGASAVVGSMIVDTVRYLTQLWTRKDDIQVELQGTVRLEGILSMIERSNYSPIDFYYGIQKPDGSRLDVIYEVIRGKPTLSVFSWRPEELGPPSIVLADSDEG